MAFIYNYVDRDNSGKNNRETSNNYSLAYDNYFEVCLVIKHIHIQHGILPSTIRNKEMSIQYSHSALYVYFTDYNTKCNNRKNNLLNI